MKALAQGGARDFDDGHRLTLARQSVFCTALNPFGQHTEEEPHSFDDTVSQKQYYNETPLETQSRCGVLDKLSRAQDQGLRLWRTKSFAIITNITVPGDCIDRVTSQNGDRVLFERLATPRPPPKITLKSYWQTRQQQQQQPQQPKLEDDPQSIWKQRATCGEQKLYSRRPCEGEDGVQQRI